jgi:hypothetical protein
MNDHFLSNHHYSKIAGLSMKELSLLEFEFLRLLRWDVLVQHEELQQYYVQISRMVLGID